ncbi:phage major capsid protein [Leucobacter sp. cx-42]|uniref:phage major capsid family protein n=1 Tax=unclassified Leucobacter TaxID=2621730 RepID=UPI00165DD8C0|nr:MULTISPECIES: phage major capsid protein [unclassified Leucobacter]MBC9953242.1 phage major capsid protein [Leucobacter sp. cx-42]
MTATALTSGAVNVPIQKLDAWLGKVQAGSSIAALSGAIPMKFGKGEAMVFDIGEAEYVGEGQAKGGTEVKDKVQKTDPFKFHKTIRMNEEVLWADEDHQLATVEQILAQCQPALSRALDFGVFHGINPTGGTAVAAMTQKLAATTSVVTQTVGGKPYEALDAADALVLANGFVPSDVALDPTFAAQFSTMRGKNSEQKLYPGFKLTTDVSELDGHRASVSRTVGANKIAAVDTDILGVVGDFSAVRWGIQEQIGLELIKYGDPDGLGDLKRFNQVAFRVEVVYGWGVADLDAFSLIKKGD